MTRRSLLALAVLALSFPASLSQTHSVKSDRAAAASAFSPRNPFVAGERLSYDVSWADFIVAGELTIQTDDLRNFDGGSYHVTARARSVGVVSGLVKKIDDVYESFISSATLQPFRAEKHSRHGKKQAQSSLAIDQQHHIARLADGRTLEIPPDTYDLAGLLFAIRGMDLTPGKARTLTLLEDDKLYTIKVQPEAREKVTTRSGSYEAVKVATSMARGRENDKLYNLRLYITNDARRLPVLITAEPSWGSVRVELTSATGTNAK